MVLRRLNGETSNAAPVLTLITQFGGGKTHTLAALYHLGLFHHDGKPIGDFYDAWHKATEGERPTPPPKLVPLHRSS